MSENLIRILIYTHATLGGISLLAGLVAQSTLCIIKCASEKKEEKF
ncbi:MAG: hypothetical protein WCI97_10860 [Bacteroidota bacterium]